MFNSERVVSSAKAGFPEVVLRWSTRQDQSGGAAARFLGPSSLSDSILRCVEVVHVLSEVVEMTDNTPTAWRPWQVSESGSSQCYDEMTEDGTLVGLYLLIAGVFLVNFTLVYVILQKRCRAEVS